MCLTTNKHTNDGLFVHAISKDNFEVAFDILDKLPVKEVLVGLPFRVEIMKKIIQSEYAVRFLEIVAKNKDDLKMNITPDAKINMYSQHNFNPFGKLRFYKFV
jgi:hypothetical protein